MTARAARRGSDHVIIAGVNKCGTTSLFRYLSDHPNVRPSVVKELGFFLDYAKPISEQTYENYRQQFRRDDGQPAIALEASPSYFTAGSNVADRIVAVVPCARFIVMLREPAERLYSYFRSAKNYDNYATRLLEGYDFDGFVDAALRAVHDPDDDDPRSVEFRRALLQGSYLRHARSFHRVVPTDSVKYVFFEAFRDAPRDVVAEICGFIGVPAERYDDYDFTVENKSRSYRSGWLQRLAFRVNMHTEAYINRLPRLRHFLRAIYLSVNEQKAAAPAGPPIGALDKLRAYYEEDNAALGAMLRDAYPSLSLPGWVAPCLVAEDAGNPGAFRSGEEGLT